MKPIITKDEYAFLTFFVKSNYIARDEDGLLCVYGDMPLRAKKWWWRGNSSFCIDYMAFPFITWEDEPWSVEELLKLEVEE